jgi:hypothetical protein
MERRKFIQKSAAATAAMSVGLGSAEALGKAQQKEVYELRVYELRRGQDALDSYFSKALIPALNRLGVKKVGVFNEIGRPEPTKIYVLISYQSFQHFGEVSSSLRTDKDFQQAASAYSQISVDQAVYYRYESSVLLAFDGLPKLVEPSMEPRIFELRTYEGYSEDAVARKIKMFNENEFAIFSRTKLNPVFFGEMIAGKNMPCLTYMVTFKNMEERDANWNAFFKDEEWVRISKAPEFANTVSKIYKTFLTPLSYSQI